MSDSSAFEIATPPPEGSAREEMIAWAKGEIERTRVWIAERNAVGRGIKSIRLLTSVFDRVIQTLFAWVERQSGENCVEGMAVVAQGGFGRRQMCLHSDVDLLLVVAEPTPSAAERAIESLVQMLWDIGQEIGHTVKTVPEALAAVGDDLNQTTALFDARALAGDASLFDALHRDLRGRLRNDLLSRFLSDRIEAMHGRHERHGNTVYLLEPNIKEGEGGLRDIHLCQWIAFSCLGSGDLAALAGAKVLTPREVDRLIEAWDFLLVVRNAMHARAGRRADLLSHDRQAPVANALEITGAPPHALAEERLLHLIHQHARVIARFTERVVRILPERISMTGRLARHLQRRRLAGGWVSCQGEISPGAADPAEEFRSDPGQMLEICAVAREQGLALSHDAREAIRLACEACDDAFRADPANRDRFLRTLRGPRHVAATVRAMAECGLLAAYLPEFKRIEGLARLDHYHRYTVEEHTLKSLEKAERLITGDLDEKEADLAAVARRIERWDVLMLGLLLHDIGKGEGRGHVVRGGQIAQRIAQRTGLDAGESLTLRELVLGHLWMPHLAFRRDIADPEVIDGLARQVGSAPLLDMLVVLTFADIRSVNPDNWSAWKRQMLWGLFTQTRRHLRGRGAPAGDEDAGLRELREQVLSLLNDDEKRERQRAGALVDGTSDRYRRAVAPREIAAHARLLARLDDETRAVWAVNHPRGMSHSEITVAAVDEPGVFSLMCGALASKQINILTAQGHSTDDGHAVETFQVTAATGGPLPPGMVLSRVEGLVNDVLLGRQPVEEAFPVQLGAPFATRERMEFAPTRIKLDNTISSHCTVLEVRTADRPGLLHALTHHIAEAGFMIYLAMISTEAYRVVDVFYLTDLENLKVTDQRRLEGFEAELQTLLAVPA